MRLTCLLALFVLLVGCRSEDAAPAAEAEAAPFRQGDRIVFFGDSITQAGARPGGYVSRVADSLSAAYPDLGIQVIGAGISGNKVPDLLARVDRDVLAHDPTKVVVYIGINDVWHWEKHTGQGTTKEDFESGLATLVDTLRQAGAEVWLCTPSVIGEKPDGTNAQDDMLDDYAAVSRRVAAAHDAHVCDLRADFIDYLKANNAAGAEQGVLTTDGVHLNEAGNRFVAERMIAYLSEG